MNISQTDLDALKSPEYLSAYIARFESERGMVNGRARFTCRVHGHKHPEKPHLRVEVRNGAGVAVCDSYGVIGDIFAVAAAYGEGDTFPARVQAVADSVGYTLRTHAANARRRRTPRLHPAPRPLPAVSPQEPAERACTPPLSYLTPKQEAAALEAVRRLHGNPAAIARHAKGLNVPEIVISYHSDLTEAGLLGLLGEDEQGHLLYIYTGRDEAGALRVRYVKARLKPYDLTAPKSDLPPYVLTPAKGAKIELWGAAALEAEECRRIIITEGESDALAVRAAVWSWLDDWAHDDDRVDDFPPPESYPLVLGCPGASVFSADWLRTPGGRKLLAADIIVCHDNDDAGRAGAARTAQALCRAGARRVFTWSPQAPSTKDAREALDPARPWELAEDILTNKRRF